MIDERRKDETHNETKRKTTRKKGKKERRERNNELNDGWLLLLELMQMHDDGIFDERGLFPLPSLGPLGPDAMDREGKKREKGKPSAIIFGHEDYGMLPFFSLNSALLCFALLCCLPSLFVECC